MCVWVEDADKLEIDSKELDIVFENRLISAYLSGKSSLGLAGIKGQGKTFLIKVKRKRLAKNDSIICLPRNNMVDIIDSSIHIDRSLDNYLIDYNIWVNIWKFAICGAIIKHPQLEEQFNIEKSGVNNISKNILNMDNIYCSPIFILQKLLELNVNDLIIVLEDTSKLFSQIREIHKSIYVFIDKLDQGFSKYAKNFNHDIRMPIRSRNASFWQYAQYSLAEASYDIFTNTSHHIKIEYTIRQEALIDSEILNKDKARNINAYITKLEYSKSDLKAMYNKYIENEEDKNLVNAGCKMSEHSKAFLGYEEVPHGYIPQIRENSFDYLYRHSFKRPYDIMKICRSLYFVSNLTIKDIRHIVNNESNQLLNLYMHELEIFIPCKLDELDRLINMIPGNILDLKTMKTICDTYNFENSLEQGWQCNQDCTNCNSLQPFSILYNLGLVGYLQKHEADLYPHEEFKNIGRSILGLNTHTLPDSKFYFLHPGLSNKARDSRNNMGLSFETSNTLLVGDGCEILPTQEKEIKKFIKKSLNNFLKEKVFISSTIFDLLEERKCIRNYLKNRGLHPIMSEHNDFDLRDAQKNHSHDCCIDEMLKCKSFIFVIGKEYGGPYSGEKYLKECEELKNISKGKITTPSISLMEFYVARKNNLKCYAFIHKDIDSKDYKKNLSQEMQNEIKFLTHFSIDGKKIKGNWISRYSTTDELLSRIKNLKFS